MLETTLGGTVLSTHPHFTTSEGFTVVDGRRVTLNPRHQLFVYFDNVHGYSCYRPAMVYNGNTLEGVLAHVLEKMPVLAGKVTFQCWNAAIGIYHRKRCGPLFSTEDEAVHLVLKPL